MQHSFFRIHHSGEMSSPDAFFDSGKVIDVAPAWDHKGSGDPRSPRDLKRSANTEDFALNTYCTLFFFGM